MRLCMTREVLAGGALASLALLPLGCMNLDEMGDNPADEQGCAPQSESSAKELTQPDFPEVSSADASASIIITNPSAGSTRATVRFGDELALDVELAGSTNCSHEPLFSYHYDVPPGRYDVIVTTDDDRRKSDTMVVGEAKEWVTIQTQEGFPLYLTVTPTKPQFG